MTNIGFLHWICSKLHYRYHMNVFIKISSGQRRIFFSICVRNGVILHLHETILQIWICFNLGVGLICVWISMKSLSTIQDTEFNWIHTPQLGIKTPHCSGALLTLQLLLVTLQDKMICKNCKTKMKLFFSVGWLLWRLRAMFFQRWFGFSVVAFFVVKLLYFWFCGCCIFLFFFCLKENLNLCIIISLDKRTKLFTPLPSSWCNLRLAGLLCCLLLSEVPSLFGCWKSLWVLPL